MRCGSRPPFGPASGRSGQRLGQRTHEAGGKAAVKAAHVLWVDADTPEAVERVREFPCVPTMTVASGSGDNLHAYYSLIRPLSSAWVERANRRLCHALGADARCAEVARVLRPPLTFNHKHDPATPVVLASHTGRRYSVSDLVADLSDPPSRPTLATPRDPDPNDTLATISPRVYFVRLTGREIGRNGKAQCPFHGGGNERTPSLHVYADAEAGWCCYGGCGGGDIYSLAGRLWSLDWKQAEDFKEIRARLVREMA